ncbi:MAG: arsenite methyltransferase [Verrucomicrobia bacterium]|nr:arsenite methyltransferase [Verrucomicrobiota bacterium]
MKDIQLPDSEKIREFVRARYGAIAEQADASCGCGPTCCAEEAPAATAQPVATAAQAATETCCAPTCCGGEKSYGEKLGYSAADLAAAPAGADLGLGCGNPVAIAGIKRGETVLDLGSGAGFDCFLAARQLAGTGRVIGVDMTQAMVTKARANAVRGMYQNVEFRLGEIEALPVADASVDLIMSNCVINLSPEKNRVFNEAFRVLKPGGRLAIADVVATKPLPPELRVKLAAIGACVGGATPVDELRALLTAAGFGRVEIVPKESSRAYIAQWTDDTTAGEFVVSALITAYKTTV